MDKHSDKPNYDDYYVALNDKIVSLAGKDRTFMMDPEFEAVFGLPATGDKIRNAVEKVKAMRVSEIPEVVDSAINRLMEL